MKVTRESDYAARIVSYLAKQNQIVGGKQISEETGISQRFALKILGKLCLEGILKSFKGNLGGYTLNREPKDITMLQVIEAIQGKIAINDCVESNFECQNMSCECAMKKAFASANKALIDELSTHTFDTL